MPVREVDERVSPGEQAMWSALFRVESEERSEGG